MKHKVESSNSCGAGLLPARYVPHNTRKCCIYATMSKFWRSM